MAKCRNEIKDDELRFYLDKYLKVQAFGKVGENYISNELRNVNVFDATNKETVFGAIFKDTKQPYIYFDFCGSWCNPCIAEIDKYAVSGRKNDNSTQIRPIWLFFENNEHTWLKIIEQFNLPRENCFRVNDKSLQNYVSGQFGWRGEFPHHFIFQSDGLIVDNNAVPLYNLDAQSIKFNVKRNENFGPSLPPPPPKK